MPSNENQKIKKTSLLFAIPLIVAVLAIGLFLFLKGDDENEAYASFAFLMDKIAGGRDKWKAETHSFRDGVLTVENLTAEPGSGIVSSAGEKDLGFFDSLVVKRISMSNILSPEEARLVRENEDWIGMPPTPLAGKVTVEGAEFRLNSKSDPTGSLGIKKVVFQNVSLKETGFDATNGPRGPRSYLNALYIGSFDYDDIKIRLEGHPEDETVPGPAFDARNGFGAFAERADAGSDSTPDASRNDAGAGADADAGRGIVALLEVGDYVGTNLGFGSPVSVYARALEPLGTPVVTNHAARDVSFRLERKGNGSASLTISEIRQDAVENLAKSGSGFVKNLALIFTDDRPPNPGARSIAFGLKNLDYDNLDLTAFLSGKFMSMPGDFRAVEPSFENPGAVYRLASRIEVQNFTEAMTDRDDSYVDLAVRHAFLNDVSLGKRRGIPPSDLPGFLACLSVGEGGFSDLASTVSSKPAESKAVIDPKLSLEIGSVTFKDQRFAPLPDTTGFEIFLGTSPAFSDFSVRDVKFSMENIGDRFGLYFDLEKIAFGGIENILNFNTLDVIDANLLMTDKLLPFPGETVNFNLQNARVRGLDLTDVFKSLDETGNTPAASRRYAAPGRPRSAAPPDAGKNPEKKPNPFNNYGIFFMRPFSLDSLSVDGASLFYENGARIKFDRFGIGGPAEKSTVSGLTAKLEGFRAHFEPPSADSPRGESFAERFFGRPDIALDLDFAALHDPANFTYSFKLDKLAIEGVANLAFELVVDSVTQHKADIMARVPLDADEAPLKRMILTTNLGLKSFELDYGDEILADSFLRMGAEQSGENIDF
ncbi:MAG: hypothetical protein LBF41_04725, partial [Deltaproteobacteria bacterium]|nr:hypothetical protein [Deltaproteobacteria bacterium]